MKNPFIKFWFEGNQCFGWVENQKDVDTLIRQYGNELEIILRAKSHYKYQDYPEFGLYGEHTGNLTLKEWLTEFNMLHYFTDSKEIKT